MFQHLCHAVSYWEKLLGRSATPLNENEPLFVSAIDTTAEDNINCLNMNANNVIDASAVDATTTAIVAAASAVNNANSSSSPFSLSVPSMNPIRRMTSPSVHALEYATRQVVTLDPVYTSHTDLDDISQPENGVVADVEISATESESEGSVKEEEEQIKETPYVANENEVLGSVSDSLFNFRSIASTIPW